VLLCTMALCEAQPGRAPRRLAWSPSPISIAQHKIIRQRLCSTGALAAQSLRSPRRLAWSLKAPKRRMMRPGCG
jgi:hypothetical protein